MNRKKILKKRVSITIDESLLKLMKEKKIKVSTYINQILWREFTTGIDEKNYSKLRSIIFENGTWAFREKDNLIDKDFKFLYLIYSKKYDDFDIWLNKHSQGYKSHLLFILDKAFKSKYKNFKESLIKSKSSAKYYSLAFRNLINFAVEKELLKKSDSIDIKEKFKLSKSKVDLRIPTKNEVRELIEKIESYDFISYLYLRILIESGFRVADVNYFLRNLELKDLELYEDIFICSIFNIRGSKSSFFLLGTKETYDLIIEYYKELKKYDVEKMKIYIKRNNLLPLKYIRKFNFTMMIENGVNFEIANFIQGRASQDIGFNHYLFKKNLALREYKKMISSIFKLFLRNNL